MRQFIVKICLFGLPCLIILFEFFLPIDIFTYRPWEALLYSSAKGICFPFYPNHTIEKISTGDLGHHTQYEVLKREDWITDKLGYRNNCFIEKPNIVLIGDSFSAGTGLPQDSTLANSLMGKLNLKVYNMAPATFQEFIILLKNKVISKPDLVIFSIVEKNIPPPIEFRSNEKFIRYNADLIPIIKDKLMRLYLLKYLKARFTKSQIKGVFGRMDSTMLFLNGINQSYLYDSINTVAKNIKAYKKFCDSIGAKFLFLPVPNKETVYFDMIPLINEPNYITKLLSVLDRYNIKSINVVDILNKERTLNSILLYHKDDTHWNSYGVNVIADELVNKFLTDKLVWSK